MVEVLLKEYLEEMLPVEVCTEEPCEKKGRYIVIEKTGSSSVDFINSATFAIKSYGDSLSEAAHLNESVKEAMFNIIYHRDISKCSLNSDYPYSDTEKKKRRYQAVFNLVY